MNANILLLLLLALNCFVHFHKRSWWRIFLYILIARNLWCRIYFLGRWYIFGAIDLLGNGGVHCSVHFWCGFYHGSIYLFWLLSFSCYIHLLGCWLLIWNLSNIDFFVGVMGLVGQSRLIRLLWMGLQLIGRLIRLFWQRDGAVFSNLHLSVLLLRHHFRIINLQLFVGFCWRAWRWRFLGLSLISLRSWLRICVMLRHFLRRSLILDGRLAFHSWWTLRHLFLLLLHSSCLLDIRIFRVNNLLLGRLLSRSRRVASFRLGLLLLDAHRLQFDLLRLGLIVVFMRLFRRLRDARLIQIGTLIA